MGEFSFVSLKLHLITFQELSRPVQSSDHKDCDYYIEYNHTLYIYIYSYAPHPLPLFFILLSSYWCTSHYSALVACLTVCVVVPVLVFLWPCGILCQYIRALMLVIDQERMTITVQFYWIIRFSWPNIWNGNEFEKSLIHYSKLDLSVCVCLSNDKIWPLHCFVVVLNYFSGWSLHHRPIWWRLLYGGSIKSIW